MNGQERAAFLLNVARQLRQRGDLPGDQVARDWASRVLEGESGTKRSVDAVQPMRDLSWSQMSYRVLQLATWTFRPEHRHDPSAVKLRDSCYNLAEAMDREMTRRYERDR